MGDGGAEGAFLGGSFRVGVDPLGIFSQLGKAVDALLVDGAPLRFANVLANVCLQLFDAGLLFAHGALPLVARIMATETCFSKCCFKKNQYASGVISRKG